MPIDIKNISEKFIFDLELAKHEMDVVPALTVSVIGFPFKKDKDNQLPVWITGFVASEPSEEINNLPLFYINAAGYSGLSGSPVIARSNGFYQSSTTGLHIEPGYHTKFIGIYSGRMKTEDTNNDSLAICNVWKPEVIDQILEKRI